MKDLNTILHDLAIRKICPLTGKPTTHWEISAVKRYVRDGIELLQYVEEAKLQNDNNYQAWLAGRF